MSATNHTTNYELPIFVGTDKPAWLVDWNGAMTAIDTAIHTAEGKADQAGTDIGGIESSISTINSTLTSINNAVSQLRIDTNANTGSINTITSLIGNGEPTTTDKTIIGAINELVDDFDLSIHENMTISNTIVTPTSASVKLLINSKGSIGKIYGGIQLYSPSNPMVLSGATAIATLSSNNLPLIEEAYDIFIGFAQGIVVDGGSDLPLGPTLTLRFKTDKTIDIIAGAGTYKDINVNLAPCLYFLKNLGD